MHPRRSMPRPRSDGPMGKLVLRTFRIAMILRKSGRFKKTAEDRGQRHVAPRTPTTAAPSDLAVMDIFDQPPDPRPDRRQRTASKNGRRRSSPRTRPPRDRKPRIPRSRHDGALARGARDEVRACTRAIESASACARSAGPGPANLHNGRNGRILADEGYRMVRRRPR